MSETKFTSGPWTWAGVTHAGTGTNPDRGSGRGYYHVGTATGESICSLADQPAANARLIAAAPMLYEGLRAAKSVLETARQYFPKSIRNSDKFRLLNVLANSVDPALAAAEGRDA